MWLNKTIYFNHIINVIPTMDFRFTTPKIKTQGLTFSTIAAIRIRQIHKTMHYDSFLLGDYLSEHEEFQFLSPAFFLIHNVK